MPLSDQDQSRTHPGAMRTLLLLALLSLAAVKSHVISLTSMYGSLESPNFPEPYPQQLDLVWDLRVQTGFRIRLDFSHFQLEPSYLCEYDRVQVEADGEVLAVFCGSEATDTESVPVGSIFSPSNSLKVIFKTDFSDEERYTGFRGHYSAQDIDECAEQSDEGLLCDHFCHNYMGGFYCSCRHGYQLHPDNRTCSVHCSNVVFRERSGVLQSPDFPGPYPKSSDCRYQIRVQTGFRISLQFDPVFDVEDHPEATCPYDHVTVQAGSQSFGPFCGSVSPGLVQTESSFVTLDFHSDDSGDNRGWSLNYTATGSLCPAPPTPPNTIVTPNQSEYSFTDHALFSCQSGFTMIQDGQQQQHVQITCLSNGTWSASAPYCQMVDCGTPRGVSQIIYMNPLNSTTYRSRVQVQCGDQTLNSSLTEFVCGADGEWTNSETNTRLSTCSSDCGVSLSLRSSRSLVKRIVGGLVADRGMFPWQVLVSVLDQSRIPERSWFGSGSLLSESWILTAAHVLTSQRRDGSVVPVLPKNVQVFLGLHSSSLKDQSQQRSVELVVLHPDFQPQNYNNDIALIKLSRAAKLSDVIRPVCLPPIRKQTEASLPEPNTLGVVAGWGVSSVSSGSSLSPDPASLTSEPLRYVRLPVVTQSECRESYASRSHSYNITDHMFCAGFTRGGHDTCLGDSGGGFVMETEKGRGQGRWTVLGVVSWAGPEDCGTERVYGVYTKVDHYTDWIRTRLNQD